MNDPIRVGIIGFDTSHVPTFTRLLNDSADPFHVPGARVVAGVPTFSADIHLSQSRVAGFTTQMRDFGVNVVDSIPELLEQVDAVLLESGDGRRHLAEAKPVIAARKPLFIDKPMAADYRNAAAIAALSEEHGCPVFSSSSLRFDGNIAALRQDEAIGAVLSCDAFSPASLEPTNPGLFWYGVHGVEILYSFMGTGCVALRSHGTDEYDVVVADWPDGRVATLRGTRCGAHDYGVTVFGQKGVRQTRYRPDVPVYTGLLQQVVPFFRSGQSPVPLEETLEIMCFMQAALVSRQEGREVTLDEVRAGAG